MTVAHDVAGVARVALAEDGLARLEHARHRDLGDPLEVALLQSLEHGHPPEQLDDLGRALDHRLGDTTTGGR